MTNKDLFEALRMFEKEKDIPMDYMLQQIQKAIVIACKNYYGGNENVVFKIDPDKNAFDVKLVKTIVDEVFDPDFEVTLEEAKQINKRNAQAQSGRQKRRICPPVKTQIICQYADSRQKPSYA